MVCASAVIRYNQCMLSEFELIARYFTRPTPGADQSGRTVAGAAAGGYAGNQVQKNMQHKDTVASVERRCKTVNENSQ